MQIIPLSYAFRPSRIFLTLSSSFLFLSKVVQGSTNYNSVFKRQLNPRPNTRYLRLSPQYWNGWPCLRVDFLGCSKDEGKNCHCICRIVIFPFKRERHSNFPNYLSPSHVFRWLTPKINEIHPFTFSQSNRSNTTQILPTQWSLPHTLQQDLFAEW